MMKEGLLVFRPKTDRPDIKYKDGSFHGGLHCGSTLEAMAGGEWRPTRIEYHHTWCLVGIAGGDDIIGLAVRN
jgi:hypothetical protein